MTNKNKKLTIVISPKQMDLTSDKAKARIKEVEKEIKEVLDARKINKKNLEFSFEV